MNLSVLGRLRNAGAVLAVGLLALSSPTVAQTSAADPASSDAIGAPAPVDAERLALSEKLFGAMRLDTTMRGVFANMFKSAPGFSAIGPNNPRAQAFLASYGAAMDATMPELIHDMAELYARVLTTQELKDSLTFYDSPSGQAIMNKLPEMMRQIVPTSMKLMPKIAAAAEADFCGKETCTDADRAMFKRMKTVGGNSQPAAAIGS